MANEKKNNVVKKIGLDVKPPKNTCNDANCPFHGNLSIHGKTFVGDVISSKMQKSAVVEWEFRKFVPKYERYQRKRTRISVHNPLCINAKVGDKVRIGETRKLSKTKSFVIFEIMDSKLSDEKKIPKSEKKSKKNVEKKPETKSEK